MLSFATQCLWYDGSALPIVRPQNQPGVVGHMLYRGTAPIFATTKLDDIAALQHVAADNPRTGSPLNANASMVLRRLKVYSFTQTLPKPARRVPYCARCFAQLLLQQSGV